MQENRGSEGRLVRRVMMAFFCMANVPCGSLFEPFLGHPYASRVEKDSQYEVPTGVQLGSGGDKENLACAVPAYLNYI